MGVRDRRRANVNWYLDRDGGSCWEPVQYQSMQLAVLMDIRDEVSRMRKVLECVNTQRILRSAFKRP